MPESNQIPLLFHQTWKNRNLPHRFRKFRATWQKYHPHAEHRLWTDKDNYKFLEEHYSWFLPIYNAYPQNIMRVDAVRYFLLKHFGGIYVDLDFECLRPLDTLLKSHQLIIGCEPSSHYEGLPALQKRRLGKQILCNAFMASTQGNPFWDHVIEVLSKQSVHTDSKQDVNTDPLFATGPFLLTCAYNLYADKDKIGVQTHEVLYPVDKFEIRKQRQKWSLEKAYAIHHWAGSWWTSLGFLSKRIERRLRSVSFRIREKVITWIRPWVRRMAFLLNPRISERFRLHWKFMLSPHIHGEHLPATRVWASRLVNGHYTSCTATHLCAGEELLKQLMYPLVSCLMVTRNRITLAQRSIECFRKQNYPDKELVIVDDSPSDELERWIKELDDSAIHYFHLADEKKPLGELRNLSVSYAQGEYITQWDDDDIFHPQRLMMQMSVMQALGVEVSFLQRQLIWFPEQEKIGVLSHKITENTMVCKKSVMQDYSSTLTKGEDTPVCEEIIKHNSVALCDKPEFYIYTFHGNNTWDQKHFEKIWQRCTQRYYAVAYHKMLIHLGQSYGMQFIEPSQSSVEKKILAHDTTGSDMESLPTLLVLTPAKNAVQFLPDYLEALEHTDYPKQKISLSFLESDSHDGTYAYLESQLSQLREKYARVELYKQDFDYIIKGHRWDISKQYKRRKIIAQSRNILLSKSLRDEEWVMWIDADVVSWPKDAFIRLLNSGKKVVVPHCIRFNGETFDLNTFTLKDDAQDLDWQRYMIDGILQPPVGYGRNYLGHFYGQDCVEVDAVGGTMLLVHADLHRKGLNFPPYSYRGYIETEGLAQMAQDMGVSCWGIPELEIIHP